MSAAPTQWLDHAHARLALHLLREARGLHAADRAPHPLLLLHGLGERSPAAVPEELAAWPGPIHALDFTGHGESTLPKGGGYTAEVLMGDVDAALARLGPTTIAGRGLGAWVALLIAGGRPREVRGVILRDGPGLAGGGPRPSSTAIVWVDPAAPTPPDGFALAELAQDVRPPEYAASFARQAASFSGLARPITICAAERVPWLIALLEEPGVEETPLAEALAHYAR